MKAFINGTSIYFDVDGVQLVPDGPTMKERPVCFLLHGGPGLDHTTYKPSLDPLTKYVQLVYIDNRGSGNSDQCDESTYTLEQNVDDIEALRKHLGLESIVVLGQSYGGMVGMRYAVKYPNALKALILITTSPSYHFTEKAKIYLEANGTEEQKKLVKLLWNGTFESIEQLNNFSDVFGPLYSVKYDHEEAKIGNSRVKPSIKALNKGFSGCLKNFDFTKELPYISALSLVIGGRHDWITPYQASEQIANLIPNSELHIIEDSSHEVFADQPETTLNIICNFLDKLSF